MTLCVTKIGFHQVSLCLPTGINLSFIYYRHRITEYVELEGAHKHYKVQLLALHRTIPSVTPCAWEDRPNASWALSGWDSESRQSKTHELVNTGLLSVIQIQEQRVLWKTTQCWISKYSLNCHTLKRNKQQNNSSCLYRVSLIGVCWPSKLSFSWCLMVLLHWWHWSLTGSHL